MEDSALGQACPSFHQHKIQKPRMQKDDDDDVRRARRELETETERAVSDLATS